MLADIVNSGQRRRLGPDCLQEGFDLRAGGPDHHAVAGVGYAAGYRKTRGEFKNEGSKPYALDRAPDENFDPVFWRGATCG
jgi:hypothetical protein